VTALPAEPAHPDGTIRLEVGGRIYAGWTAVRVTRDLQREASEFEVSVTERWADRDTPWIVRPGAAARLTLDDAPLVTGWIDTVEPSIDGQRHGVTWRGASRTVDLVDCSAMVPGGQFVGYDLAAIARALAGPFGLEVAVEAGVGRAFAEVQINQGERAAQLLQRLAALRQVLVTDDADGRLVLTRPGERRSPEPLVLGEGGNVLAARARLSQAARHSAYTVKAQAAGTDFAFGPAAAEVRGEATDPAVTRHRPLLLIAEAGTDAAGAGERARWEATARAAGGTAATVTVRGWRRADGTLWRPNERVRVTIPPLQLDRELLVLRTVHALDAARMVTELTLAPPEALAPEPAGPEPRGDGAGAAEADPWKDVEAIR